MTVAELTSRASGAEIDEWAAYYRLEPFGEWRGDFRAGVIASTVFNVNRCKNAKARTALDFMPLIERPEKPQPSVSELRAKLMQWLPPKPAQPN